MARSEPVHMEEDRGRYRVHLPNVCFRRDDIDRAAMENEVRRRVDTGTLLYKKSKVGEVRLPAGELHLFKQYTGGIDVTGGL